MPLNDHPSAKPTYDFYDTVNAGKTAIANGDTGLDQLEPARPAVPARLDDLALALAVHRWPATWSRTVSAASTSPSAPGCDGIRYYYEAQAQLAERRAQGRPTWRSWISSRTSPASRASSTARSRSPPTACWSASPTPASRRRCRRMITFAGGSDRPGHLQPREHASVVGRQRLRGQLQPDLLQGGDGHPRRVPLHRPQRPDRGRRPRHGGGRAAFQQSLVDQFNRNYANTGSLWTAAPRRTRHRPACSPAARPTPGPERPTSHCGKSSGRTGSTGHCRRSSGTTAATASPSRSSRRGSPTSCPTTATHAVPGSARSSPSGSTPPTRPAAPPTAPS